MLWRPFPIVYGKGSDDRSLNARRISGIVIKLKHIRKPEADEYIQIAKRLLCRAKGTRVPPLRSELSITDKVTAILTFAIRTAPAFRAFDNSEFSSALPPFFCKMSGVLLYIRKEKCRVIR